MEWGLAAAWALAEDAVNDPDNSSVISNGSLIPWVCHIYREQKGRRCATMVVFRAIMNVLPEKQKEVRQTLLALIDRPEMGEGCLSNGVSSDIGDDNIFYLISEWETRRHLEKFLRSDGFSVLLGTKSLLTEPLKIDILTVSNSESGETVDFVRTKSNSFSRCTDEKRLAS